MGKRDPRVDDYIDQLDEVVAERVRTLREAFHRGCPELQETIKWGVPHFEHHGLLGGIAAFKHHIGLGFWRGASMQDPAGLFDGAGRATISQIKLPHDQPLPRTRVLVAYVREAAALNEAGEESARRRRKPAPKVPPILAERLDATPGARANFETLTPSQQRDYIDWITGAKREATRERRLEQALMLIAEGKDRNWKYRDC